MKHSKGGGHVLIVDREAMLADSAAEYMRARGHTVEVVATTTAADQKLKEWQDAGIKPVVVLSDGPLKDTHISGIKYLEHMRNELKFEGAILMHGWPDESERIANALGRQSSSARKTPKPFLPSRTPWTCKSSSRNAWVVAEAAMKAAHEYRDLFTLMV